MRSSAAPPARFGTSVWTGRLVRSRTGRQSSCRSRMVRCCSSAISSSRIRTGPGGLDGHSPLIATPAASSALVMLRTLERGSRTGHGTGTCPRRAQGEPPVTPSDPTTSDSRAQRRRLRLRDQCRRSRRAPARARAQEAPALGLAFGAAAILLLAVGAALVSRPSEPRCRRGRRAALRRPDRCLRGQPHNRHSPPRGPSGASRHRRRGHQARRGPRPLLRPAAQPNRGRPQGAHRQGGSTMNTHSPTGRRFTPTLAGLLALTSMLVVLAVPGTRDGHASPGHDHHKAAVTVHAERSRSPSATACASSGRTTSPGPGWRSSACGDLPDLSGDPAASAAQPGATSATPSSPSTARPPVTSSTPLLNEHITGAVALLQAAKSGDADKINDCQSEPGIDNGEPDRRLPSAPRTPVTGAGPRCAR